MTAMFLSRRLGILSLAVAAVCVAALLGGTASAALLAYDPFLVGADPNNLGPGEYARGTNTSGGGLVGSDLGGQNPTIGPTGFYSGPWVQSSGDNSTVGHLGENSLKYPDLPGKGKLVREANQFSCCTFGRNGRALTNPLGFGADPIYNSFLIDFGDQGTDDPTQFGKRGYELWNGGIGDGNLAVDFFFNHFSGVNVLSISLRGLNFFEDPNNPNDDFASVTEVVGGGPGLTLDDLAAAPGRTHFVVLKFEFNDFNGDPNDPSDDDIVSVWLDPTSSLEGAPTHQIRAPLSNLVITHQSAYTHFTFSGGGHNPGAIDEIRWGDTFADVTPFIPEPATLTLAGLSVAGMLLSRRRK